MPTIQEFVSFWWNCFALAFTDSKGAVEFVELFIILFTSVSLWKLLNRISPKFVGAASKYSALKEEKRRIALTFVTLLILSFVFISPFRMYKDVNDQLAKNWPALEGKIRAIHLGGSYSSLNPALRNVGGIAIMMMVSISNLGTPSVVDPFSMYIEKPDGSKIIVNLTCSGNDPRPLIHTNPYGHRTEYSTADELITKCMNPITTGGRATGWLLGFIPEGHKPEDLAKNENRVVLLFSDVRSKQYTTAVPMGMEIAPDVPNYDGVKRTLLPAQQ